MLSRNNSVMMCSLLPCSSGSAAEWFPSGSVPPSSSENPTWRTLTMFGDLVRKSGAAALRHSFCAAPLGSLLRLISLIRQGVVTCWCVPSVKVLQNYRFIKIIRKANLAYPLNIFSALLLSSLWILSSVVTVTVWKIILTGSCCFWGAN